MLLKYLEDHENFQSYDRIKKKRRLDNVDIIDKQFFTKLETERIICKNVQEGRYVINSTYWDSPEAKILFKPNENESVQSCLRRREEILLEACLNDDAMILLTNGYQSIKDFSSKQK